MLRSLVLSLLSVVALMSSAVLSPGADESYQGVFFTTPPGWVSGMQDGRFIMAPQDMTDETAVVVVLYGAEKLGGKSLDAWFKAKMNGDLNPQAKVLNAGEIKSTSVGELKMLTTARAIQDAGGGIKIQMYHGVSDGRQAALAMGVTASEKAINKYSDGIRALFESLRFSAAENGGANPSAGPASSSTPAETPSSQPPPESKISESGSKQVTVSDLVGHWTYSTSSYMNYVSTSTGAYAGSSTVAYGEGFDFAADGTYQYNFTGISGTTYVKEKDSGTWAFEGGRLVIRSKEGRGVRGYNLFDFKVAPDGTRFITLLSDVYKLDDPKIASAVSMYGEKYVRAAAKKSDSKK